MASNEQDPLFLLRQSIASGQHAVPIAGDDAASPECDLSQASHLRFPHAGNSTMALDSATRFQSNDSFVNLRSIYFAWLNREVAIPEYNASAAKLNEGLSTQGRVQNLAFVERLDLITWLEGASEESEYIKPLAGERDADGAAAASAGTGKGAAASAAVGRSGRGTMDPRLAAIYGGERRMGDRNSVLRGIKPTDFSHVRKLATVFVQKRPQHPATSGLPDVSTSMSQKPSSRRPDPIILLSPSASSLLRMSNIRSFLEEGRFVPTDGPGTTGSTMLHVTRLMRDIDPTRPLRFILVEGPEQFKPEYWNRVVAVFTTGQSWQFKNYKWPQPQELFHHVVGIYVGWRTDEPPETIRTWGHRVMTYAIDRWRDGGDSSRFRDKEVVESIWKGVEASMRSKGWKRDAAPTRI